MSLVHARCSHTLIHLCQCDSITLPKASTMPLDGNKTPMFPTHKSATKPRAPIGQASNQARERSQHRGERTRSNSQTSNREAPRPQTANRRLEAETLKIGVPNNVPNGHTMKHQTSQSTLSEYENGYMQKMVKQEPAVRLSSRNAFQVRCCNYPTQCGTDRC